MNKVLFVVNKFGDINNPKSNMPDHNCGGLISSFQDAGLAEYDVVYYDDYAYSTGKSVNAYLQDRFNLGDYSAVIALLVHWMPTIPRKETMANIAKKTPIAYIWYDAVGEGERVLCEKLASTSAVNVFMDTSKYPNIPADKILSLWFPRDSRMYYADYNVNRGIGVSWLGNVDNYHERGMYLDAMRKRCVPIWMPAEQLSNQECCDIWRGSKIGLNFSAGIDPVKRQFKTRVMEVTLCGAMLLESRNEETKRWFTEGVDYVSFSNTDELHDKISYYLSNGEERERIAKSGCDKATRDYNSRNYWHKVLDRLR